MNQKIIYALILNGQLKREENPYKLIKKMLILIYKLVIQKLFCLKNKYFKLKHNTYLKTV